MSTTGLRERNKAKRRAAIMTAAYELFAERGYAATTVADIADAADVAPRTVSLYFPTKQDIALAGVTDIADGLARALSDRQPGDSMVDAVAAWLRAELGRVDQRELELLGRVFDANPELRALSTAHLETVAADGLRAIADELEVQPDDPRARIAVAAMGAVIEYVLTESPTGDVDEAVDLAAGFLRAGLESLRRP